MTNTKTTPIPRSRLPLITGTKIVRFKIPALPRRFTVHEDLICATSTLFSRTFQPHRKPLLPTTECCICTEHLSPITTDLSYCATCGQNMHEACIESWKRTAIQKSDDGLPTCPMCRATWKNEPMLKGMRIAEKLDAESVQCYIGWLYSSQLHIPTSIDRKSDAFNLALLKCWAVASAMEDASFKKEVLRTFFEDAKARFWRESVQWVFVEGWANEEIRGFVVEVFMAFVKPGWFKEQADMWPDEFVRVLADKALEGMEGKMGYEDVKNKWLGKLSDTDKAVEEVEEDRSRLMEVGDTDGELSWGTSKSKDLWTDEKEKLPRRKRQRRQPISLDRRSGANAWE